MHCIAELTQDTDKPLWVSKAKFFEYFDQGDFNFRARRNVLKQYLEEWVAPINSDECSFVLPTVNFELGKTQFINGRHRTAVLLLEKEEIPIAFIVRSDKDQLLLDAISQKPVDLGKTFEIPDYPIIGVKKEREKTCENLAHYIQDIYGYTS